MMRLDEIKLGNKIICIEIYKSCSWQNFTIGKIYTIIPGDRICPLTIIDNTGQKLEPNWYQFISLSKQRKDKLKKLNF